MSSYTNLLYHIIWAPKHRQPVLTRANRPALYRYLNGCLKKRNCKLIAVNGVEDHVHLLASIHQSRAVAQVIGEIKRASSLWIKTERVFDQFTYWQKGYGAFSVSRSHMDRIVRYIANQETHHQVKSFRVEYLEFLDDQGIEYKEEYLWV